MIIAPAPASGSVRVYAFPGAVKCRNVSIQGMFLLYFRLWREPTAGRLGSVICLLTFSAAVPSPAKAHDF